MTNETKLIPELEKWKKENGDSFDISNWVASEGSVELAIGYSKIFWPEFLKCDGSIFFKSHFSKDNYLKWKNSEPKLSASQIENVINHIHILDLFSWEKQPGISVDQIKYLGNILCEIVRVKLKSEFPDQKFEVYFNSNEDLEDLIDYKLSFYQIIL